MKRQGLVIMSLMLLLACGGSKRPGHYDYGIQYFDAGDYTDAARHFSLAWEEKKQVHALFNLGLTQLKLGDFEAAVRTYRQYLTQNSDDWQAQVNLGHALAGAGDNAAASDAFAAGIAQNATWPEPYCAFAQHLLAQNTETATRKALGLMEKATALGSENSTAWFLHGQAAQRLGDTTTAKADMEQAVSRDANNRPARMLLADLLMAQQDWSGARRHYISAAALRIDHASLLGAGICHRELGELVMAQDALNHARRLAPNDAATLNELLKVNLAAAKANLIGLTANGNLTPEAKAQLQATIEALQKALGQ